MNLKKELKNLKGATYEMSHPTDADIEAVKKEKGVTQVERKDLPRETIENVLLNCLANYAVHEKKETFLVQQAAAWINEPGEEKSEPAEKVKNFIIKQLLPDSTWRKVESNNGEEAKVTGLYTSWVIAQVFAEFGVDSAE